MMNRTATMTLLMLPIGAIAGFLCAFVVIIAGGIFHFLFGRLEPADTFSLFFFALVAGVIPGAFLGALVTPLVYLIFFRDVDLRMLTKVFIIIGFTTVLAGTIGSLAQELLALFSTLVGFVAGVFSAFAFTKDQPKTSLP